MVGERIVRRRHGGRIHTVVVEEVKVKEGVMVEVKEGVGDMIREISNMDNRVMVMVTVVVAVDLRVMSTLVVVEDQVVLARITGAETHKIEWGIEEGHIEGCIERIK